MNNNPSNPQFSSSSDDISTIPISSSSSQTTPPSVSVDLNSSIEIELSLNPSSIHIPASEPLPRTTELFQLGERTRNTLSAARVDRRAHLFSESNSSELLPLSEISSNMELSSSQSSSLEESKEIVIGRGSDSVTMVFQRVYSSNNGRVFSFTSEMPRRGFDILPMLRAVQDFMMMMEEQEEAFPDDNEARPLPTSTTFIQSLQPITINESNCINGVSAKEYPKCSICCELAKEGDKAIKLPCDHLFHYTCILEWLKQAHTCPICRHELPQSQDAN